MARFWQILIALLLVPTLAQAEEATIEKIHDAPAVRGSIIAAMLQDHDNPFLLYPYETNYLLYTYTNEINKQAISSYDWAEQANKDEVKFQLSLAFPIWRGIAGDNSLLGASYTQRSWWQASNSEESSPFRETNYEPQLFWRGQQITNWLAGLSAKSNLVLTINPTVKLTQPHVVGTVFIPA